MHELIHLVNGAANQTKAQSFHHEVLHLIHGYASLRRDRFERKRAVVRGPVENAFDQRHETDFLAQEWHMSIQDGLTGQAWEQRFKAAHITGVKSIQQIRDPSEIGSLERRKNRVQEQLAKVVDGVA